jgi:uncharacterized protein YndB with AHSA1/START domain
MSETQTPATPALTIRRIFKAPRARVFAAWTKPEILSTWFGPQDFTIPEAILDVRVGGRYRITLLAPDGERYVVGGVFSEVRPPEFLAYTWRWEHDERDTAVTIAFFDRGKETEMLFTHEGFADADSRGRHDHGWASTFEKLAALWR